ncbi:sec-independent protein translocase protein TatB [Pseudonocardia autotrophica]|uniref:Sec-independent protein translocase protein TatB n=2 Tax=Pseudonocardia TaxID=1847 RepID=A0A1Y2N4N1_PSEAH|nr:Sec-independent protein translocase protein TatB [Pseudonocardia autotrophica]TDN75963.1 sec-independent protein translocase protein TatB [Pseudonocardia autotrophica]BBF99935.1 sec-independent protein translocase protein TatB [Pseudonocardia autotrophica]GEC24995.1 sec-independent protein translocase protein TatB [Pseudonocardia saturnea]
MFENIGMWEILILVVAGLFILGPERLPEAARWLGSAVRQVKEYATGAQDHLKRELGPEFDKIQQPLNDLRSLRSFNPRTAITRSLFSDDEPVKRNGHSPGARATNTGGGLGAAAAGGAAAAAASGTSAAAGTPASGDTTPGNTTPGNTASGNTPPGTTASGAAPTGAAAPAAQQPLAANERPPVDPDAT